MPEAPAGRCAAPFGIRYRVDAEIVVDARLSVKVIDGIQMAHLKLRPQIAAAAV